MKLFYKAISPILMASVLAGCMGSQNKEVIGNDNTVSLIEKQAQEVGLKANFSAGHDHMAVQEVQSYTKNSDIVFVDEDYISGDSYVVSKRKIPSAKDLYLEMTIQELTPSELSSFLTERLGIHVRFDEDVLSASKLGASASSTAISTNLATTSQGLINIRYFKGKISKLLDNIAIQSSSFWRYSEKSGIEFYLYESVSYTIPRFATEGTWSLGNVGGASATASTQAYTERSSTNAGIKSIINGIKARMSPKGKIDIDEHTSTITMTDVPPSIATASAYLESEIKKLAQQILVRVDVYEVVRSNANDKGMSVTAAFQSIGNAFSMIQQTSGTIATPVISSSMAVLPSATGATQPWDNSSVVFQALNQRGVQVTHRTGSTLIMNGEAAPIKDLAEISYIESLTSTTDPNSGALGVGQVNGVANDGIEITIVPLVQDNKKILLKLAIEINKVFFTNNANGTQSTRNERKNIPMTFMLKDGATAVISGLSTVTVDRQDEGIGSADFKWFGGKEKNSYKQSLMLISVTPTMVNM